MTKIKNLERFGHWILRFGFYLGETIEAVLEPQIMFESKAPNRFKSGAYTLVREHFGSVCNAAIGH
jgi:hypothetical protein